MQCTKTTVTTTDGFEVEQEEEVVNASECCTAGQNDQDSMLLMACEDFEEVTYVWDPDEMECTMNTITTTQGVVADPVVEIV